MSTVAVLRFYPGTSRFIPVYPDLSNRDKPGQQPDKRKFFAPRQLSEYDGQTYV